MLAQNQLFLKFYRKYLIIKKSYFNIVLKGTKKKKINPIKFKRILKAALYSLTSMMIVEVISVPFSTRYLIPFIQLGGMNFYVSTLLLYIITFISAIWFEDKKV